MVLDIFKFIEVLVFNERVPLETLELSGVSISDNELVRLELLKRAAALEKPLSLHNLTIGAFDGGSASTDSDILRVLVLNRSGALHKLGVVRLRLSADIELIRDEFVQADLHLKMPMAHLHHLCVQE